MLGVDKHQGLLAATEQAELVAVNFVLQRHEFTVVAGDPDTYRDGIEFTRLAAELMREGSRQNVIVGRFEIEATNYYILTRSFTHQNVIVGRFEIEARHTGV